MATAVHYPFVSRKVIVALPANVLSKHLSDVELGRLNKECKELAWILYPNEQGTLEKLISQPHLNGQKCVVIRTEETGRIVVRLTTSTLEISVKRGCIRTHECAILIDCQMGCYNGQNVVLLGPSQNHVGQIDVRILELGDHDGQNVINVFEHNLSNKVPVMQVVQCNDMESFKKHFSKGDSILWFHTTAMLKSAKNLEDAQAANRQQNGEVDGEAGYQPVMQAMWTGGPVQPLNTVYLFWPSAYSGVQPRTPATNTGQKFCGFVLKTDGNAFSFPTNLPPSPGEASLNKMHTAFAKEFLSPHTSVNAATNEPDQTNEAEDMDVDDPEQDVAKAKSNV